MYLSMFRSVFDAHCVVYSGMISIFRCIYGFSGHCSALSVLLQVALKIMRDDGEAASTLLRESAEGSCNVHSAIWVPPRAKRVFYTLR